MGRQGVAFLDAYENITYPSSILGQRRCCLTCFPAILKAKDTKGKSSPV